MSANGANSTTYTTPFLIGDSGVSNPSVSDSPPTPTLVNNVPVSSALELQSTTGAFYLPRMTTTERNALSVVANGSQIFNTTTGSIDMYSGSWVASGGPLSLIPYTVTLTPAEVMAMYAAPIQLVAAVPNAYLVLHRLVGNLIYNSVAYTSGANVTVQYGSNAFAAGTSLMNSAIQAAVMRGAASALFSGTTLSASTSFTTAQALNKGLYLANGTDAFASGNSNLRVTIWYSIVSAV